MLALTALAIGIVVCIGLTLWSDGAREPAVAVVAVLSIAVLTWICIIFFERYEGTGFHDHESVAGKKCEPKKSPTHFTALNGAICHTADEAENLKDG